MDKLTQPQPQQQLSLSFDAPAETVTMPISPSVSEIPITNVAAVYDFTSAAAKREASTQAVLYRQIIESVRHIG